MLKKINTCPEPASRTAFLTFITYHTSPNKASEIGVGHTSRDQRAKPQPASMKGLTAIPVNSCTRQALICPLYPSGKLTMFKKINTEAADSRSGNPPAYLQEPLEKVEIRPFTTKAVRKWAPSPHRSGVRLSQRCLSRMLNELPNQDGGLPPHLTSTVCRNVSGLSSSGLSAQPK